MRRAAWGVAFLAILLIAAFLLIPNPGRPLYSQLLYSQNGTLLHAELAADGQLRFPPRQDTLSAKFKACLLAAEDEYFYRHPGINPISLVKALWQNVQAGHFVRGGSTLTMQLARIHLGHRRRSLWAKVVEMMAALKWEITEGKQEILLQYAAQAPFGGNTVGLGAASWRYFGRSPQELTWAEAASLAVLPNAPGRLHLNRARKELKAKRDRLLKKLAAQGQITPSELQLSLQEPLPGKPRSIPRLLPHLAHSSGQMGNPSTYSRSINEAWQRHLQTSLQPYANLLRARGIDNLACLVWDNKAGVPRAYLGNVTSDGTIGFVDLVQARRSYGSLLKPFLYAASLDEGIISPNAWLEDVPRMYGRFAPRNYFNTYEGVVPASEALQRSLNMPFVSLLDKYGTARFLSNLQAIPLPSLDKKPEHYGLTLILGGGEESLWNLTKGYAQLANTATGIRNKASWQPSQAAAWLAMQALRQPLRPDLDPLTLSRARQIPLAWKTGTSPGLRDAWAIGVSPRYTIGIWVGNADGEGRPGLTGIGIAAPALFLAATQLKDSLTDWFDQPASMAKVALCATSGYRKGEFCPDGIEARMPATARQLPPCPNHIRIFTDPSGRYRADAGCLPINQLKPATQLTLTPRQAYHRHKSLKQNKIDLPWLPSCAPAEAQKLTILYPTKGSTLTTGNAGLLARAYHSDPNTTLYWFLDSQYQAATQGTHKISINPKPGPHTLTITDEEGRLEEVYFHN